MLIGIASANCRETRPVRPAEAPATAGAPPAPSASRTVPPVAIEMKNVHLHEDDGIVLDVRSLRGEMISERRGEPPVFDDPRSYVLRVQRAALAIDFASLETLLNQRVFAGAQAPLQNVHLTATADRRLRLNASMRKGVSIPVSLTVSVGPAADGRLALHVEGLRALHVPVKGLLDLFGLQIDSLVDLERRGVAIHDNDVTIDVGQILPPPVIRGRLTRAAIEGDRLVQVFGSRDEQILPALSPPDPHASGYVYFSGSDIRFGKLTMHDADLQLIDADARDPFEFFPARYERQLVAGYSKNTARGGLRTYMPDFDDLQRAAVDLTPRHRRAQEAPPQPPAP
jgi:hypothetical protein